MTPDADRPILLRRWTLPRPSQREWRPVLLRRSLPADVYHGTLRLLSATNLIAVFIALQFLIPARLVISGMGAEGRPSVAIGVLLAFLWLVSALRGRLPSGPQPVRWVVGIFVLVQVVGNVIGFDRLATPAQASGSYRWLIVVVGFVGVTLAMADGIRLREQLDRVLKLIVLFASAMSIVGVLQFFGVVDLTRLISIPGLRANHDLIAIGSRGDQELARVAGTATHYIEYGVVLALVLPIALHYALFARGRERWWRWAVLGLVALGIPLSISRAAIVTVFIVGVMLAVSWTWRMRYNAVVIGLAGLTVFHVLNRGVLGTILALFTHADDDPSVTARIERAATVMELWQERPIFGWGSGMVTPQEFLLLDNQVFMFLIASGVVGVVVFVLLYYVPYLMGRSVRLRGSDAESRHLGHTLAITMPAAVVVSATFDSFSFSTFVAVSALLIGAVAALWRMQGGWGMGPVRRADEGDGILASPVMADHRERFVAAWQRARGQARG